DLLNLAEKNDCVIKQRSKKPITVVSKFNIFNSQDLFNNIFTSNKTYNREKRNGLHRRFSKSLVYTHGYMIRFTGQYLNERVFFSIVALENQKNYQPRDLTDFINGRFDIKFNKEIDIIEAQKYVYDDDIENLYEKDNIVYMKHKVYNSYWNEDLSNDILMPKNLETIGIKLQEKILQKQIEFTTLKKNREEDLQIEELK
ncbi:21922_t:CDS:2, partial [Gigaspora margarita]